MATVKIYEEHRDILDDLISSSKVASAAGATKTGPFKDQRDAYVFAASIAVALDSPTPEKEMPSTKSTPIRDHVFLGAEGARELAIMVVFASESKGAVAEDSLRQQLEMITKGDFDDQFALLDRYAHAGFSWLAKYQPDESSIRDLILTAFNQIECVEHDLSDRPVVKDPLLDMLL